MAAGEVDFLRDQVHRLNVILSQYQEKYLTLDEDDKNRGVFSSSDPLPPWLTNKGLLSPLVTEYDKQLETLREQNHTCKREFWDLQTKVDHLVGENRRLHEDLRSSVESRLRETQPLSANEVDQLNEENVLHNLQQQVQLITQERDSAKEMLASNIKELDKVRHDLQEARNEAQFKAANYQLIQERSSQVLTQNQKLLSDNQKLEVATQHFQTTLNAQSAEVDQLRDHLQQSRAEHRAVNLQLHEMKKVLDQLKQEMMRKDGETSQAVGREYAADSRLTQLQASLMEMENQISNLHFENKKLQSENKELEEKFNILQTKGGDAEKREYDATMQVRESVQLVENAILEKDQAVIREQQKSQELHRLQEALSKLINEAGLRTKQEVEHVRKQCNNNIAKLMEEIQALEMDNAEKQAQMERAIREKRSVEQELEKLYREGVTESGSNSYQALQGRLINAERSREEALMRVKSLDKKIRTIELSSNEEKAQSCHTLEKLKNRLDTLSKECEEISEERLQLLEEIDDYKKRVVDTEKEKESSVRQCQKKVTSIEQEISLLRQQYEAKLDTIEESNRQSTSELKQLLGSQQRMSARWREESKTLTEKFETKIRELRGEISELKKRNEELNKQITLSRNLYLEAEQKLADHMDNNRKLNHRLLAAEQRVSDANQKLAQFMSRERQILQDKQHLQKELDRSKLETSRPFRGGYASIRLSDLDNVSTYRTPRRTILKADST